MASKSGGNNKPLKSAPTSTPPGGSRASNSTEAGHNRADAVALEPGKVYSGIISQVTDDGALFTVALDQPKQTMDGCQWAAGGIFSQLLGFKLSTVPSPGTGCLVVGGSTPYIVGVFPGDFPDMASPERTMTGPLMEKLARGNSTEEMLNNKHSVPQDLLEGEFEIANMVGVFARFLTTLVSLGAGDRAKVECALMDDMVRIVSGTFKHFSAFGDMQIYNDGRLNVRFDGTSYPHESYNKESPGEALVDVENNKVDPGEVAELGRRRFSMYLGFLGDFIHTIVTDPPEVLGTMMEDQLRSGKGRVHVANDGSVLVQSTCEIAMERVVRIPVPQEKLRQDDPEGLTPEDYAGLNRAFLKSWDFKNAHHSAYQLREYSRWLSGIHGYARFLQIEDKTGDWAVAAESDVPEPDWDNKEADRNSGQKYIDAYATMRIMRDGSIALVNAQGASATLVGNDIQVSAPGRIDITAAGDLALAGRNVWIKARNSIDISATHGGIVLRAKTWWKALCEKGSVWIKSDAPDPQEPEYEPWEPADEMDPQAQVLEHAVFLDAPEGQSIMQSKRTATVRTTGDPDTAEEGDLTAAVHIQSEKSHIRTHAKKNLQMVGDLFEVKAAKKILLMAQMCLFKVVLFDVNKSFTLKNNRLFVKFIHALGLTANNHVQVPSRPGGSPRHENHVSVLDEDVEMEHAEGEDYEELDTFNAEVQAAPPPVFGGAEPEWRYPEYPKPDPDEDRFEPLAFQHIRLEDPEGYPDYADWPAAAEALDGGDRTGDNLPPPGDGAVEKRHDGGETLREPSSKPYGTLAQGKFQTPLADAAVERKAVKETKPQKP